MGLVVLSLFDGISCGRVALERAGLEVDAYFASEIDTFAIQVAKANWPNIIEVGDVSKISYKDGILHTEEGDFPAPKIDIVIGGSPCQGFSNAGKRANFDDPRSRLFWEYVRILKEVNPKYFLLENVVMKKEWENIITDAVGVQPIMIDSARVAAAVRKRLYWTNMGGSHGIEQPEDRGITFGDVREHDVPEGPIYYSEKGMAWIHHHEERTGKKLRLIQDTDKMQMLEASMYKKYSAQRFFGIKDTHGIRYITVLESERCMGLPDGYTAAASNTQAYKQLGNGWNVDTIVHIMSHIRD